MSMVCIRDAKECCASGFPPSGNCMLVEATLPVRYSCSSFTFYCCLESYFLKHVKHLGTHLSENTWGNLLSTLPQGVPEVCFGCFQILNRDIWVFSAVFSFYSGNFEKGGLNVPWWIVGIRAGNFKVMVSNELHSSRSINMYLCVHTLCMCVWLMYGSIWDMWMFFVNSVYVWYVWHVCTVCMICV